MTTNTLQFQFNDGGRAAAGYKGATGDCVCRSIAVATGMPYQEAYDIVNNSSRYERTTKRQKLKSSARTGVRKTTTKEILKALGWKWTPTMLVGQGCKVHLCASELPAKGTVIVSVSKHLTVVKDGVILDTYDPSREGTRCVYGYWTKE